jgi:hypothetical protein
LGNVDQVTGDKEEEKRARKPQTSNEVSEACIAMVLSTMTLKNVYLE